MTATYWLADSTGAKALVEGSDERDRWLPHGWTDTTKPTGDELVWCNHPDVEHPGQIPAAALADGWAEKGWTPGLPPEPINPLTGTRPTRPTPPAESAPAEKPAQAKPAAGGTTKEK